MIKIELIHTIDVRLKTKMRLNAIPWAENSDLVSKTLNFDNEQKIISDYNFCPVFQTKHQTLYFCYKQGLIVLQLVQHLFRSVYFYFEYSNRIS